ncbi:unnamed protein product, partial [Brassica rapa subsp. narinosa]
LSLSRSSSFPLSFSRSFFFFSASDSPEIHRLSRDLFSSSLPPIHRRSTISLSFHWFSAVHTVDSYFCTRFPTVPEKLCSSLYESHNPASTHLLRCTMNMFPLAN